MKIQLLPFQRKAVARASRSLEQGRAVCVVAPTGSGKTIIAQAIAAQYPASLCVVHTRALLKQAQRRLGRAMTIQALLRPGRRAIADPALIVWDECHHSAAEAWGQLREQFPRAALLGLTATPQRGDGRPLDAFDSMIVAAQYSDLLELGVIVPCRVFRPSETIDGSDPDPVAAYRKYANGSRAVFYVGSVEQADGAARRLGRSFAAWHYGVPWGKRARLLKAFAENELRGLVTVDALTEGFDLPSIETIVLGRTCQHAGTYLQIVGRGLRAAPGKSSLMLLDLSGASTRHGSPTADRAYTIDGDGISGSLAGLDRRQGAEPEPRGEHDAELVEVIDWSRASETEKRKARADLRRLAQARGFDPKAAELAGRMLFE